MSRAARELFVIAQEANGCYFDDNSGEGQCPSHVDHDPSLSVNDNRNGDGIVVHCHAGCPFSDIVAAVAEVVPGYDVRHTFDTHAVKLLAKLKREGWEPEPVERRPLHRGGRSSGSPLGWGEPKNTFYTYPKLDGVADFRVLRLDYFLPTMGGGGEWHKDFSIDHRFGPPEDDMWVDGIGDAERIPFRLPQLRAGIEGGKEVWVVEGEKCVLVVEDAGGVATCNVGGSGAWKHDLYAGFLRGAEVVNVARDRDKKGAKWAEQVVASARAVGVPVVRLVEAAGELHDIGDHLAAGHALDEVLVVEEHIADRGTELLNDLVAFVRRFVVLDAHQAVAVALWIAHCHAIAAAETTPYLAVTSAEKRSGKSRLVVELLPLLVPRPLAAANISVAALAHSIAADPPSTLLLDEADATFGLAGRGGLSERAEGLRGILNAGHRRGGTYTRMTGQGAAMKPEHLDVFGAKAIAGIGELPDTIADRSIAIRMKRKAPSETVSRFRRRVVKPEAALVRGRIAAWVEPRLGELRDARPVLPDALDDRAQDGWEPLLAIADAAGARWAKRAREAAVVLSGGREGAGEVSLGERLLMDVRQVFDAAKAGRLSTAQITAALNAMEEAPWGGFKDGLGIGPRALARMLREYDITSSGTVRPADGPPTAKGYKVESFRDAWSRYAVVRQPPQAKAEKKGPEPPPAPSEHPKTSQRHNPHEQRDVGKTKGSQPEEDVTDENGSEPASQEGCDVVTDRGAREAPGETSGGPGETSEEVVEPTTEAPKDEPDVPPWVVRNEHGEVVFPTEEAA